MRRRLPRPGSAAAFRQLDEQRRRLALEVTHGGHFARASRRSAGRGELKVVHRSADPRLTAGVGTLAAEAALHAQRATVAIMGWDGRDVDALIVECAELDRAFEAAAERP